jgi:hypothetical protein
VVDVWIKEKEKEKKPEELSRDLMNEMDDFVKVFEKELTKVFQKNE